MEWPTHLPLVGGGGVSMRPEMAMEFGSVK